MLRLGAVEVYHVQTLVADVLKLEGHLQRMTVDGLLVVVAFCQAHTLSVDNVYGGYQFYHNARKFLMICSPTRPLFSGWNWQV